MTTYIESIVDTEATLKEAEHLSKLVVEDLCERKIILPTPQTHEFLEDGGAQYATGPQVLTAAETVNDCFPSGLTVETGRRVYDTGELGCQQICPQCGVQHADDFGFEAIGRWFETGTVELLTCRDCDRESPFVDWFEPAFGFGNLAFRFYEWFLKPEFIEHVAGLLDHRVTWVKSQY